MYQQVNIIVSVSVALCMGVLRIEDIPSPPRMIKQPTTTELLFQEAPTGNISHQPLIIECEAEAQGDHPELTYLWKKNGKEVDILRDTRVSLKPGNGTLVVNHPQASDAGIYQCFAENDLGIAVTSPIRVRKAFLDDFNDTAIVNVTADEGNHFKLECNAPLGWPKPQVIWMYRNASSNMSISSPRITVDPKGTLWFSNVTLRDDSENGFLYVCGVISHFSQERRMGHGIRLTIKPRELITTAPELLYFSIKKGGSLIGGSLELWCIFGGSPLPEVTWLKDGKPLQLLPEIILMNHNKTLRINNVTYKEKGTYTCTGSNGIDPPVSRDMDVVVQAAPNFTKEPQVISATEDENAELECNATGVPTPTISWLYNGQSLSYFLPHNPHIKARGTTKIQFTKLKATDTGNYGCNASNSYGNVYKDVYVNVVAIDAQITKAPQNVSTVQGSSVTLKCEAIGVPTPKVSWVRSGQELLNTSRYTLLGTGDLNIASITFADDGDYTCRAQNRYHTEEKIASTFVKNATRVIVSTKLITVSDGSTAFLDCSVTADPTLLPLAIDWFRGNESIRSLSDRRIVKMENNTLRIRYVTVKDGGVYRCTAKTELDNAAGDATLIVRTVPNPPEITLLNCFNMSAHIFWKQVQDVLTYSIEYSTNLKPNTWEVLENDISSIKDQSFVSLSPWVNYTFRVVAINQLGRSQPSNNSAVCTTNPNHPFKNPDNVTGRGNSSNNLIISWTPMPQIDHNGPGFRYQVKWKSNDSNVFQNVWNETEIKEWTTGELVITDQPTYKPYLVQVRAINDFGESNATANPVLGFSGQDVPTEAPEEFTLLEEIDATTAKLRWKPVKNETIRGKFEGYKIQHWTDPGNVLEEKLAFDITETEIKSLTPLAVNYIQVRAFNTDHEGPPSPTLLIVTPEGTPGKVTNFTVRSLGTDSFYLQWEPPKKPNGVLIGYEIYYEKSNMVRNIGDGPKTRRNPSITDPKRSTAKLAGLEAGMKYKIYISAKTRKGLGDEFVIEESTKKSLSTTINKPSFRWDFVQEGQETWSARIYWIPNFSGSAGSGSNFYVEHKESNSDAAKWNNTHVEINEDFIDLNHLKLDEAYLVRVVAINNVTKEFSDAISSDEIRGIAARREIDHLLVIGIVVSIIVGVILLVIIVGCIVERIRESRYVVEPLSYSIKYANEVDNPAVSGTRFGSQFRRASSPKPS